MKRLITRLKDIITIDELLDHYIDYMTLYELFGDFEYLRRANLYKEQYEKAYKVYYE